jgi:hypothetical protein
LTLAERGGFVRWIRVANVKSGTSAIEDPALVSRLIGLAICLAARESALQFERLQIPPSTPRLCWNSANGRLGSPGDFGYL